MRSMPPRLEPTTDRIWKRLLRFCWPRTKSTSDHPLLATIGSPSDDGPGPGNSAVVTSKQGETGRSCPELPGDETAPCLPSFFVPGRRGSIVAGRRGPASARQPDRTVPRHRAAGPTARRTWWVQKPPSGHRTIRFSCHRPPRRQETFALTRCCRILSPSTRALHLLEVNGLELEHRWCSVGESLPHGRFAAGL
jgi:hypothetical protein